jgi:hypothetical protein
MSKTDKTKPARLQIAEATAKHGEAHINWHTDVTYSRYKDEGYYTKGCKQRALARLDWRKNGY